MTDQSETFVRTFAGAQNAFLNADLKQALYDAGEVIMADTLVTLHGDLHRKRRATEFRVFGRGFFRHYENEVFPKTLSRTLAPYVEAGKADLIDLGYRATINLTADFAGIDRPEQSPEETEALRRLVGKFSEGATMVHSTRDPEVLRREVRDAIEEFDERFLTPSKRRRQETVSRFAKGEITEEELPRDLMTVLLRYEGEMALSEEVFRREICFFMQAGAHSTSNSTVHAFHEIYQWSADRPEEWDRILSDDLFLQRCVHESFRLHPASPVAWRKAMCPVHLSEAGDVAADSKVVIDLYSANRDVSVFGEDADVYNPYRELPANVWPFGLTFGYGVHSCLGRDLDGGVINRDGARGARSQLGIVALFLKELFALGARPDPDRPPIEDEKTQRPNWGVYPILFERG